MAVRTRANFKSTKNTSITTNGVGDISGADVNSVLEDLGDSVPFILDYLLYVVANASGDNLLWEGGNTSITGAGNIAIGDGAMPSATVNNDNVAIGTNAGQSLLGSGGDNNILIGAGSGGSIVNSDGTVAIGVGAGAVNVGGGCVFIGDGAGQNLTNGAKSVAIGELTEFEAATGGGMLTIQNAIFGDGNDGIFSTMSDGVIKFYSRAANGSWAKALFVGNGDAEGSGVADGCVIYAKDVASSSELFVCDEAGNKTQISPHNFTLIGGPSEAGAWSYFSEFIDLASGKKKNINVDMLKVVRALEKLTGETLVTIQDA